MPAPTWLLQEGLRDRALFAKLCAALDRLGVSWRAVHVVPFATELPEVSAALEASPIVCYGPSFVPRVVDHPRWRPGIWFDREAFRWSAMQAGWRDAMLSAGAAPMKLGDAVSRLALGGASRFVRPDADDKSFDGGVYDADALRAACTQLARDTPVIIAEPVQIDVEWRCLVVDDEVVDSSEYRRAGQPSLYRGAPTHVCELAEAAATRWSPARVTCIDLARSGDRLGIIEANCFNAARIYAMDVELVVARVTAAAVPA